MTETRKLAAILVADSATAVWRERTRSARSRVFGAFAAT
jgi:hypothetical protein